MCLKLEFVSVCCFHTLLRVGLIKLPLICAKYESFFDWFPFSLSYFAKQQKLIQITEPGGWKYDICVN